MLSTRKGRAHAFLALVAAAISASVAVLYTFPVGAGGFYPWCPIHAYTGLLCPGCGATRALDALVHGHVAQAFAFNPLVTLLVPVVLIYFAEAYRRAASGGSIQPIWPVIPRAFVSGLLAIATVFTVIRNLS